LRNVIILGAGRSGTSLAAGILQPAGYFMGENLYPADEGNPKGYFESWQLNSINEALLAPTMPSRPQLFGSGIFFRRRPPDGQRWLAVPHRGLIDACPEDIGEKIEALTAREPYCLKDPRFCYTLSLWKPFLRNTAFVCIFRHPGITANSLIKECKRVPEYRRHISNVRSAYKLWAAMYNQVLDVHFDRNGQWLFFHYNQILNGTAFKLMEEVLEAKLDPHFAEDKLNRSTSPGKIPENILKLYRRLCELAKYSDRS
jgi:hypothetical protein